MNALMSRRVTGALLFVVLGVCLYRARTQSFTTDEAWVFARFVNQPLAEMARSWDACNHVLHTLLMKGCREVWGISEHVLRIPSLLGAVLYLSSVYMLTRLLFAGWTQPLAAGLLTLHPLVLDLMVAARGYGLALGLFGWSLYCALSYCMRGWNPKWLTRAGVLAGLSVAANLTFAVPVAALGSALWWMRKSWSAIDRYFGPAFLIPALIVSVPLLQAKREDFYVGAPNLMETFRGMYTSALKSEHSVFAGPGSRLAPYVPYLTGVLLGVIGAASALALWRRDYLHFRRVPLALVGTTLCLSVAIAVLARSFGVLYPSGRTGLYLIPLFTLAALLLAPDRRLVALPALLLLAFYAGESENRYFAEWRYDAGTRDLIRRFDEDRYRHGLQDSVKLAVDPVLWQSAKYYRLRRNTPWMEVVAIDARDAPYALFDIGNAQRARAGGFQVVAEHPVSGAVLVRRVQ